MLGNIVERLESFPLKEKAWRVQILLNVIKSKHFLDCRILKLDIIPETAALLFEFLDVFINDLNRTFKSSSILVNRGFLYK